MVIKNKMILTAGIMFLIGIFLGVVLNRQFSPVHPPENPSSTKQDAYDEHGGENQIQLNNTARKEFNTKSTKTPVKFKLSTDVISKSEITVKTVKARTIRTSLSIPGEVTFNTNKTVRIVAQISGIVKDVKKNQGDQVKAGDVLVVIKSRELSEAQARCLTAKSKENLALEVFNSEEELWKKKISSENDYLKAKNKLEEARIEFNSAKQSLLTLGLSESDVTALVTGKQDISTRYEIKSPIAGVVVKRNISNGELIATDTDAFVIADISTVWVDVAIHADQVRQTRIGHKVVIRSDAMNQEITGKFFYLSPEFNKITKTVTGRIEISNESGVWRPGLFVMADVILDESKAATTISNKAIQIINEVAVVFIRKGNDFELRRVKLGRSDGQYIEILEGLLLGETYVDNNSFVLKAHVLNMEND